LTFRPGGRIASNSIHLAIGRHAADVLVLVTILDHDQIAPRSHTQIVAAFHHRVVMTLEKELEAASFGGFSGFTFCRAGLIAPDLAQAFGTAISAREIAFILAPPNPFAARELGGASRNPALSQIGLWCFDVV